MAENTNAAFPPESPSAEQTVVTTGLNVGDIEWIVKYIDYNAQEGNLKGWQMIDEVAQRRNRYVQFLRDVQVPVNLETSAEGAQ
jgi:hypothetical protein